MFRSATSRLSSLLLATACACALVGNAFAARVFPQNSIQVVINAFTDDTLVANNREIHLAPGVLIFTQTNATIVKSQLPVDAYARIQIDLNGDVRRIWLLTADEIVYKPWWNFWGSNDIKEQPNSVVPTTDP